MNGAAFTGRFGAIRQVRRMLEHFRNRIASGVSVGVRVAPLRPVDAPARGPRRTGTRRRRRVMQTRRIRARVSRRDDAGMLGSRQSPSAADARRPPRYEGMSDPRSRQFVARYVTAEKAPPTTGTRDRGARPEAERKTRARDRARGGAAVDWGTRRLEQLWQGARHMPVLLDESFVSDEYEKSEDRATQPLEVERVSDDPTERCTPGRHRLGSRASRTRHRHPRDPSESRGPSRGKHGGHRRRRDVAARSEAMSGRACARR